MDRGYLKLWRKSIDSEVFANESLWRLWSWCLMKTSYKTRHINLSIGKGEIVVALHPGQFVFGRNKAAEALGWNPSTTWDRIRKLEAMKMLTIQSNKQYSMITICNWVDYQSEELKTQQPTDNQPTSNRQPTDTNKNVKKVKNVKNSVGTTKTPAELEPEAITEGSRVASYMANRILSRDPKYTHLINGKRDKAIRAWAIDIEKIHKLDSREWSEIWRVIEWCLADDFWSKNILSGSKLRKKFSDLVLKMQPITHGTVNQSGFAGSGKRLLI